MKERALLTRKQFLMGVTSALAGIPFLTNSCVNNTKNVEKKESIFDDYKKWWKSGEYIVHESVDTSFLHKDVIKARIEGQWDEFTTRELPQEFVDWNFSERLQRLELLAKHGFQRRDLAGPHNACVATCGGPKRDSSFSINTAYKGMGFIPRKEKLSVATSRLKHLKEQIETMYGDDFRTVMVHKTREVGALYSEKNLFDTKKQVSLELFTRRDHPTHTFLNMMTNPAASVTFLDFPAFELRVIPQLLHPLNPNLSDYEREIIDFTNTIHSFIHGDMSMYMACVYHIVEVFDDSPNENAMGKRLI